LDRSGYSNGLTKEMVWLSGLLPYEHAEAVLARVGQCAVSATSLWRQSQRHGERLKQHVEAQRARTPMSGVVLPVADHAQRKGVSMDGGMIHIRGEGWKEFKVGTAFDVETRWQPEPITSEQVALARATRTRYSAVLGSVDEFAPAVWTLALQHGVVHAADSAVVADGAEWIWNLVADYFPDSVQVVDWYHATQHLANAAHALHADDPAHAQRWFDQQRETLYQGQAWQIIQQLEAAGLPEHARYFHTHQRRMRYQMYREEGYPIGSGTVESGIKQYKARLTGPGMRWSRPGAERMLVLRAAVMEHSFDDLWKAAA
jgi:hypothetical protein